MCTKESEFYEFFMDYSVLPLQALNIHQMLWGVQFYGTGTELNCDPLYTHTYILHSLDPQINQMTTGCGISHKNTTYVYKYNSK
jgi:hypothetical protein